MKRNNLLKVYDCINRIAMKNDGRDRSAWFYTSDEFAQIKNDKSNTIL